MIKALPLKISSWLSGCQLVSQWSVNRGLLHVIDWWRVFYASFFCSCWVLDAWIPWHG
jgi:hypothetical protein